MAVNVLDRGYLLDQPSADGLCFGQESLRIGLPVEEVARGVLVAYVQPASFLGLFQRRQPLLLAPVAEVCLLDPNVPVVESGHASNVRNAGMPQALVEIATLVSFTVTVHREVRANVAVTLTG